MAQIFGKKWLCPLLSAYLVFALTGAFTFSVIETLDFDGRGRGEPAGDSLFTSLDHSIDWLAVESNIISKARKYSSSTMRNGALRFFMQPGSQNGGAAFAQVSLNSIKKIACVDKKSAILVKLRI